MSATEDLFKAAGAAYRDYVPVRQVWTRRELPCELAAAGPAVRVVGSRARPGEFVFEIHAMGDVMSVHLDDEVLAELHRQAMAVRRDGDVPVANHRPAGRVALSSSHEPLPGRRT